MAPPDSGIMHETYLPLEVAVFSGQDALRAQRHGARRIELNATGSYDKGGLTPKVEELLSIVPQLKIPVRIMIRPRGPPPAGSDFVYTDEEFAAMRQGILDFKAADVMNPVRGDGFVFGILRRKNRPGAVPVFVDLDRCQELVDLARPFPCVFHRAYDPIAASTDWANGFDAICACGFEGVLTSGGPGRYSDNLARLQDICRRSAGLPVQVVVGGGVRKDNVANSASELAQMRGCNVWMHTACIVKNAQSPAGELSTEDLIDLVGSLGAASME